MVIVIDYWNQIPVMFCRKDVEFRIRKNFNYAGYRFYIITAEDSKSYIMDKSICRNIYGFCRKGSWVKSQRATN